MALRRFIAGAGLCLLLNLGCVNQKKELNPVSVSAKSESTNPSTKQLAEQVADLSQKIFPGGGVLSFGKNEKGLSRYLSIDVLNEKNNKALYLQLYIGSSTRTEEIIDNEISTGNYISAKSLLENSGWDSSLICDFGINGINPTDKKDYSGIRKGKGYITILQSADLFGSLREVEELYNIILQSSLPLLEQKNR